jgi:hypothetical protein
VPSADVDFEATRAAGLPPVTAVEEPAKLKVSATEREKLLRDLEKNHEGVPASKEQMNIPDAPKKAAQGPSGDEHSWRSAARTSSCCTAARKSSAPRSAASSPKASGRDSSATRRRSSRRSKNGSHTPSSKSAAPSARSSSSWMTPAGKTCCRGGCGSARSALPPLSGGQVVRLSRFASLCDSRAIAITRESCGTRERVTTRQPDNLTTRGCQSSP